MDTFETVVYPRFDKYIRRCFPNDEDRQSICHAYAWYLWHNRKDDDLNPICYARAAVRAIRQRRDLPHLYPFSTSRDAMDRECWLCGQMGAVRDHEPKPDKVAERRELIDRLKSVADEAEATVIDMLLDGFTQRQIARELGVTPHTVIAIKRRLAAKL